MPEFVVVLGSTFSVSPQRLRAPVEQSYHSACLRSHPTADIPFPGSPSRQRLILSRRTGENFCRLVYRLLVFQSLSLLSYQLNFSCLVPLLSMMTGQQGGGSGDTNLYF